MGGERSAPASLDRAAATRAKIMKIGARLFAERGYAATSMRHLAERTGVSLSASYYYFPAKHDVLVAIMGEAMDRLEVAARDVMATGLEPAERFAELVRAHVRIHLAEPDLARVADGELRALKPSARRRVVDWRDRYEDYFRSTLAEGVEQGVFSKGIDIPVTAMATITMATATVEWWRPSGRLSIDETAALISNLTLAAAMHAEIPPTAARERTVVRGR